MALIIAEWLFVGLFDNWRKAQELAKASDVGDPVAVGKQPIVADAVDDTRASEVIVRAGYSAARLRLVQAVV